MKVSKRQLRRIIKEEKLKLSELGISRGEDAMAAQEAEGLYVNLEDAQVEALDALERALSQCSEAGVLAEDIHDIVANWT